ncbi:MAG: (d)CMP kinase [Chitinivibrionales bacterium]|nr:(d)CMP kinase [Chitinivibrionales bacterium]
MIIAIDGPAGSGKSSTAVEAARRLGFLHLDTGAMYRAITLKCLRQGIDPTDTPALASLMEHTELDFSGVPPHTTVWMDGEDVSTAVRSDEVTRNVSDYCKPMVVRNALVAQQREIGKSISVVCEGRDIGTVVFPDAELKFFMVASVEERARRRQKDFLKLGITKSLDNLIEEIRERDHKDSSRENSPLCKAGDAEEIDTTTMSFDQQVSRIVEKASVLIEKTNTG